MADKFSSQMTGVFDGTKIPADRADGRQVNGRANILLASKIAGEAWNNGDVIYLGPKPAGFKITDIKVVSDTSFATAQLDIGIGTDPRVAHATTTVDKYVDGKTMTVVDIPTSVGPEAVNLDDAPPDEEHLYLTVGIASIAAAVIATIMIEMVGPKS